MTTTISSLLVLCLQSFNALVNEDKVRQYESEVPHSAWQGELGRLRVWASNIGAHQTGQSSLDYRLRDASHISQQIKKLLDDLTRSIRDINDILDENTGEEEQQEEADIGFVDPAETTELQQLFEEVVMIIHCLYQMSMLIRKPAKHDRIIKADSSEVQYHEPFDRRHVADKYPDADRAIVKRLAWAITRRRGYLKYSERHRAKLEKGIEDLRETNDTAPTVAKTITLSETVATEFKESHIHFDETGSNSGISQTSYAPSIEGGGAITVPSPPKESAEERPFECPYCFFIITITNRRSWTRHVFNDIQPYICTFESCTAPDKLYESRREWFSHQMSAHRHEWLPEGVGQDGRGAGQADHEGASLSQSQSTQPAKLVMSGSCTCPLCLATIDSTRNFERHLARHLEELALFALPRDSLGEDLENDSNKDDSTSIAKVEHLDSDASEDEQDPEEDTKHDPVVEVEDETPYEWVDPDKICRRQSQADSGTSDLPWWRHKEALRTDTHSDGDRGDANERPVPTRYTNVAKQRVCREVLHAFDYPFDENEQVYMINARIDTNRLQDIYDLSSQFMVHQQDGILRQQVTSLLESKGPQYEYFLPAEGVSRGVIQSEIYKYLGNDTLVRPGRGDGQAGYLIQANRKLTDQIVADLKADLERLPVAFQQTSAFYETRNRKSNARADRDAPITAPVQTAAEKSVTADTLSREQGIERGLERLYENYGKQSEEKTAAKDGSGPYSSTSPTHDDYASYFILPELREHVKEKNMRSEHRNAAAESNPQIRIDKAGTKPLEQESKYIRFKDAVGRKFAFPFHLCATWAGEIILPQVWETVVQPDWTVTMRMWPMPEEPDFPQHPFPAAKKPNRSKGSQAKSSPTPSYGTLPQPSRPPLRGPPREQPRYYPLQTSHDEPPMQPSSPPDGELHTHRRPQLLSTDPLEYYPLQSPYEELRTHYPQPTIYGDSRWTPTHPPQDATIYSPPSPNKGKETSRNPIVGLPASWMDESQVQDEMEQLQMAPLNLEDAGVLRGSTTRTRRTLEKLNEQSR